MSPAQVAIVDDHPLVGALLARELEAHGYRTSIVEPTDEHLEAKMLAADFAVLDLDLGSGISGHDLVAPLTTNGTVVIIVSGSLNEAMLGRCLLDGATTVVSKALALDDLHAAVIGAIEHGAGLPRGERERLIDVALAKDRAARDVEQMFGGFTAQEQRILQALVDGRQAAEIASDQFVSVATVRTHIRAILSKLGVNSQLAAVSYATRHGWSPTKASKSV